MISVDNKSSLTSEQFADLEKRLELIGGLNVALEWALSEPLAGNIPVVITQDEFTHDVVFSYGENYVVFDTTWLGAIAAVAVFESKPSRDDLLEYRLSKGWEPTPTLTVDGEEILGHCKCTTVRVA